MTLNNNKDGKKMGKAEDIRQIENIMRLRPDLIPWVKKSIIDDKCKGVNLKVKR